uniref:LSM12 homolog n=1 Tax=Caligus clemensi TaxID=344056 RepID=C1C2B4_CALCM|nr:LSM12 homolog [Caligus clemensi]
MARGRRSRGRRATRDQFRSIAGGLGGFGDCMSSEWSIRPGCEVSLSLSDSSISLRGEVTSHDPSTRFIVLRVPSSSGDKNRWDIHVVNLGNVEQFSVLRAAREELLEEILPLDEEKLQSRCQQSFEKKKRSLLSFKKGVSPKGQKLFQTISKTIEEVTWAGKTIVVMNRVSILPPYGTGNIRGVTQEFKEDDAALSHIRKIVEKHVRDQEGCEEI